ncbi:hypothetical protein OBB02_01825 [Candidatus Puniceispirillum sp.]|nr:hypothetical protein [Candidatus Puniceispirillum sp.]
MPITKPEERMIRRTKQDLGKIKAATHLLFAICLCSCLPERFRHEKYDCSSSLQSINTIIINRAKTGNYAKVASPTSETEANITQIDEQTAWLTYKSMRMKINRKTGALTMVQGNKYRKVKCKKTVFTM